MDSLVDFLLNFYGPTPYLLILAILLACGLGVPIPEDITLFAAGLLAYYGVTKIGTMILVALIGVLVGDSTIFYLGVHYGRKLTRTWFFRRLLPEDRLNAVKEKFHQKGNKVLFAARFMPGLRAPVFFSAGTLHIPFRKFIIYDGCAALISVPAIVGAVYYFGDQLDRVVRVVKNVEHSLVILIVAIVCTVLGKWYLTQRSQRRTGQNSAES